MPIEEELVFKNTSGIYNEEEYEKDIKEKQDQARQKLKAFQAKQRAITGSGNAWLDTQCVTFAKQITGVYGTWGNGGRNLTNNSEPQVGAVLIFDYTHVGVIIGVSDGVITYTDRNSDNRGTIRPSVNISVTDPSISKIHAF